MHIKNGFLTESVYFQTTLSVFSLNLVQFKARAENEMRRTKAYVEEHFRRSNEEMCQFCGNTTLGKQGIQ